MIKKTINIVVVENSEIIFQGISNILADSGRSVYIQKAENIEDIGRLNLRNKTDLVLMNPFQIQNQVREFQNLKKEMNDVKWAGIVYTYFDQQILACFDDIIYINDSPGKINFSFTRLLSREEKGENHNVQHEALTEREADVLKLLVAGNANKQIADKLNISTHTVISHRKKITLKTGIKSVSGLTIYAVVNNLLSLDDYRG